MSRADLLYLLRMAVVYAVLIAAEWYLLHGVLQ